MSSLFYFVRHGITKSNQAGIYAGRNDESILSTATPSILGAAAFLRDKNLRRIFSSPLQRARATGTLLATALDLPLSIVDDLTELDFGPWSGLTAEEIRLRDPENWQVWRQSPFDLCGQRIESLSSVQIRILDWLRANAVPSGNFCVVTHESVIKALLCSVLPNDRGSYRTATVKNGSIHLVTLSPSGGVEAARNVFEPS